MTGEQWTGAAQSAAEHVQKVTGAWRVLVILLPDPDTIVCGAYCPPHQLGPILRQLTEQFEAGTAAIVDRRNDKAGGS